MSSQIWIVVRGSGALALLIILAFAAPVFAQESCSGCEVQHAEAQDICPSYYACTMYGLAWIKTASDGSGYSGAVPIECKQSSCRTCQTNPPHRCVSVALWANCQCDDIPVSGAGAGITQCDNLFGNCMVR